MTLLDIQHVSVEFRTSRGIIPILHNVSFSIGEGEVVGVVGESGSGKSVTALSVMRLIPTPLLHSFSGNIVWRGRPLASLSESQMRAIRGCEMAMIFQEPMTALNPVLTIGDQIVEVIKTHEVVSRREAKERALTMLEEVGIPDPIRRFSAYPHEMSGGMRQRAMIAMAMILKPKLLIADEPTTALDVSIQAQILNLIRTITEKYKMAVMLITHDLGVMAEMADSVVVMRDGRIQESGSVTQIFHAPTHAYTNELLQSIRTD